MSKKKSAVSGRALLSSKFLNQDDAFSAARRSANGLRGLLPTVPISMELQCQRCYEQFRSFSSDPMSQFLYLMSLADRNTNLFYALLLDHLQEMMPIVYTPTVGTFCQTFTHTHQYPPRALFVSLEDSGSVTELVANWPCDNVKAVVVTDGSRILGLGDQGLGGIGIPIGKLTLFTACGGVDPEVCMPTILDVGTDNQALLDDPLYQGLRRKRNRGSKEFYDLVEEFVQAVTARFGDDCLIQWEDFSNDSAFDLLEKYESSICTFNDDIQGTASVGLAALIAGVEVKNTALADERILFLGAGEAAVGIADLFSEAVAKESNGKISTSEARKLCYMIDSKGLLDKNRGDFDRLLNHKKRYCHEISSELKEKVGDSRDLLSYIKAIRPTAIIGVSAQGRTFTKEVVKEMCAHCDRPVIFPLSNPTSRSECTAEEAFEWSDGKVLFASGSPFDDVVLGGKTYEPTQANNVYIFPGVATGTLACGSIRIVPEMFMAAATVLGKMVSVEEKLATGRLFPPQQRIREVAAEVGASVAEIAYDRGFARAPRPDDLLQHIKEYMYQPSYS